ncbi:hypothetical protein EFK50_15580 [Nocardioides marmoriginsengisoli]|uniref:Uncharacterized protein n=1 Tax=Nocardioides marmoriginsengisoli TaxID=661483 RepID=A0A3N0CIH4_9ACTN|nr:hypothetical protein [Nocardioides marmoriginsengisoli]RNL63129.1 hypothetical protein EFK50_15580 [Nocardioides marmoriginsengisoli]
MSAPTWLTGFIDDAAIFPPGNLPLGRAVAEHREHRSAEYADLVGSFVVGDGKVPELIDVLDEQDHAEPLDVNVVVSGGAGAIAPSVRWASRAPSLRLRALEFALRDEDDLAHNARRVLTALDAVEEDLSEVQVYVELPRWTVGTHGWLSALDVLATAELRAKFRTGGVEAEMVPSVADLATGIDAVLDRELPFKCTAGLHHALGQVDATGVRQHGFLNVLVATRVCLDGGDTAAALAEERAEVLLDGIDTETLARTRRWFTSFGSCSILEPHDDLVDLGLVEAR